MQYEKLGFLDAVETSLSALASSCRARRRALTSPARDLYDLMTRASRFFEQNLADTRVPASIWRGGESDAPTRARFALGYATDSWNVLLNRFGADESERRRLLQAGLIIERDGGSARAAGEAAGGHYDRFRDRVMFPIRDSRGRVLGFGGA